MLSALYAEFIGLEGPYFVMTIYKFYSDIKTLIYIY